MAQYPSHSIQVTEYDAREPYSGKGFTDSGVTIMKQSAALIVAAMASWRRQGDKTGQYTRIRQFTKGVGCTHGYSLGIGPALVLGRSRLAILAQVRATSSISAMRPPLYSESAKRVGIV